MKKTINKTIIKTIKKTINKTINKTIYKTMKKPMKKPMQKTMKKALKHPMTSISLIETLRFLFLGAIDLEIKNLIDSTSQKSETSCGFH